MEVSLSLYIYIYMHLSIFQTAWIFILCFGKPEHSADVVEISSGTLEESYMRLLYILKRKSKQGI